MISNQELLIEIRTYEHLIYVIHLIANDLTQSGDAEAQQIAHIKSQIDKKWMSLDRKLQSSAIFKGKVTLHFPGDVRDEVSEEEVGKRQFTLLY